MFSAWQTPSSAGHRGTLERVPPTKLFILQEDLCLLDF